MNCAQVKEQLVDYLYGELSASARSAFVEHLRGCPGCQAEVAGHERALGHARGAITGPLLQEPPARVRLAVMEAARTQARALRQAERADRPGFFARLLRTPWVLPAFGAVSVATVVFLVRVLKDPEVVPGQRPTAVFEERVPPAAEPVVPPEQAQPPEPAAAAPAEGMRPQATARRAGAASSGTVGSESARKLKAASANPLAGLKAGAGSGKKEPAASPSRRPAGRRSARLTGWPTTYSARSKTNGQPRLPRPPPPRCGRGPHKAATKSRATVARRPRTSRSPRRRRRRPSCGK